MSTRPKIHLTQDTTVPSTVEILARFSTNTVLRNQAGLILTYQNILQMAQSASFQATRRRLVMCQVNNDIGGIAGYLGLLAAEAVLMMVSTSLAPSTFDGLVEAYQPDYLWLPQLVAGQWPQATVQASYHGYCLLAFQPAANSDYLHADLALLLSTSGSTGSGKYVRLSKQNIWTNAAAIANYLDLSADELPITTLPPNYSYGLSVIHSHLWVGAGLAVTNETFFSRSFWNFLREAQATSIAGVPYHYEILKKLRFTKMYLPDLRTLTQAGGHMGPELTQEYATHCANKGMRFFTMYGQTEASPRMSYVPAEHALAKTGSIGIPIQGGTMELQSETGEILTANDMIGELVYRGPNVFMGYADCRADLSLGYANDGILHTGDLAQRDTDGFYRIVGRQKRFIKLFGNRINLLDVEQQIAAIDLSAACTGRDDVLEVYLLTTSASKALEVKEMIVASLQVSAQGVAVYGVDSLPRSDSGKVRYAELRPDKAQFLA